MAVVRLRVEESPELERIVAKCLEDDRGLRYQHASEIRADLQRLKRDSGSQQPPATAPIRSKLPIALSAAALLAAASTAGYLFTHRDPKLTDRDTIILADFQNKTGDPVWDETLRQGLSVQLAQSPYLSLISDDRIQQTLHLMEKPPGAPLTPDLAREICERTNGTAILEGSISSLGGQYVLSLRARNCRTGNMLDEQQVQAAGKEDVLNVLTQIAGKFRTRAGESLAAVRQHETPLMEATTSSIEALKAYSASFKFAHSPDPSAAVPLLRHAIELDPNFTMAYAFLGRVYGDTFQTVLAAENVSKAYALRNRTSERERFFITVNYDLQVTGNLEQAFRDSVSFAQTYPRDREAHAGVSGICQSLAKYPKAIEAGNRVIEIDPDFAPGPVNAAWSYIFVDRLPEAEAVLRKAVARKLEFPDLFLLSYYSAFLKGDQLAMERAAAAATDKPGAEDWMLSAQASVSAYSGRLQQSRTMIRRAMDLALQGKQPERAAMYQAGAAVREAFFGNAIEARRNAMAALQLSQSRDVEYGAAFALALAGDTIASQALAKRLERFPEDSIVQFTYLPVLGALAALKHGDPPHAIDLLRKTAPYDLAIPGSWFGFFGNLYPIYVRGQADLEARKPAEAAAEFQRILDHPGILFSDPVGVAARMQMAKAYVAMGDQAKARAAYKNLLDLWKNADEDIPIGKEARAAH